MKNILIIFYLSVSAQMFAQINVGLKAHYPLNADTNDYSGNSNNGVTVGTLALTEDRFNNPNSAFQFPGNDSNYISISFSEDFNIPPTGQLTISLWFKGYSLFNDSRILFGKQNPTKFYTYYDYNLGLINSKPNAGGNGKDVLTVSICCIQQSQWTHLVLIYDNLKWYLYKDKYLIGSQVAGGFTVSQSTNGLVIGKKHDGAIDDVRFYNRALSLNEISELYHLNNYLGTEENSKKSEIKIFPNPTDKILTVSRQTTEIMAVDIYDFSGKLIYREISNQKEINIDVSSFPGGMYTLKTSSEKFSKSTSFIKK